MKCSVLSWITLVTVFAIFLPVGGLAASQGPVRPESGNANGYDHWVYLPLIGKDMSPSDCRMAPWLISPPDGSSPVTSRPVFQWNNGDNPGARIGRYEFALNASFQQVIYWGQREYPGGTTSGSVYSQPTTTFQWGTTYYWRATLQCADGRWLYSPVWSFTPFSVSDDMVLIPAGTFQMGCDEATAAGAITITSCRCTRYTWTNTALTEWK